MKVFGVSIEDLERIVNTVSLLLYDGNLVVRSSSHGLTAASIPRCTFSLGVKDSSRAGPGAQASSNSMLSGNGPLGRPRTSAACWHAYHDVIATVFAEFPRARIDSLRAKYTAYNFAVVSSANAVHNQCECELPVWIGRSS